MTISRVFSEKYSAFTTTDLWFNKYDLENKVQQHWKMKYNNMITSDLENEVQQHWKMKYNNMITSDLENEVQQHD